MFDTMKTVDSLTSAGIAEAQAKAITAAMRDAVTEGVATKADLARLETRLVLVNLATAGALFAALKLFGA